MIHLVVKAVANLYFRVQFSVPSLFSLHLQHSCSCGHFAAVPLPRVEDIVGFFDEVDDDGSGEIDLDELMKISKSLGFSGNRDEMREHMKVFD